MHRTRRLLATTGAAAVLAVSSLTVPARAQSVPEAGGTTDAAAAPALPRGDAKDTIGASDSPRETLYYKVTRAPGERVVLSAMSGRGSAAGYLRVESQTARGLDCARITMSTSYARGAGAFEPFGDCVNDTEVVVGISRGNRAPADQELLLRYQGVPVPINQVPDQVPALEVSPELPTGAQDAEPGPGPFEATALPARAAVQGTVQPDQPQYFRVPVGWGQQLNVTAFAPKDAGKGSRISFAVYDPALKILVDSSSKLNDMGTGRTTRPVLINNFGGEDEDAPYLAGDYIIEIAIPLAEEGEPPLPAADYVLSSQVLGTVTGVPVTAEEQAAAESRRTRQRVALGLAAAGGICLVASAVLFVRRR